MKNGEYPHLWGSLPPNPAQMLLQELLSRVAVPVSTSPTRVPGLLPRMLFFSPTIRFFTSLGKISWKQSTGEMLCKTLSGASENRKTAFPSKASSAELGVGRKPAELCGANFGSRFWEALLSSGPFWCWFRHFCSSAFSGDVFTQSELRSWLFLQRGKKAGCLA